MPTISWFYGIAIRMYWNDHSPPHFHALYGDDEATIALSDLTILEGYIPKRALTIVCEWAALHREELERDWELCRLKQMPDKIAPLP
ncbi:DUF4160 domain-containing protein [Devosia sp. FKR38]|uniref:DUF4160 domain-containing protein n=1 Tax=Devosia sp. FKR38 TaxID=2562312 RepID=UPI0010C11EF3|nr:DUF4160 domain-containing protein [Devosia sp. FKR38]